MSNLKNQVVNGVKWSAMAKLVTQLFSWFSTFYVIRLLTPDDYGLIAIAAVFFTLITMFTTNGLISAVVKEQNKDRRISDLMFSFSLMLNLGLTGILVLTAPWIAEWYDSPDLKHVLWVLAIINPLSSFTVIPIAHLQIDMRFKDKAIAETIAGLTGAVVAIVAAQSGLGVWSLVLATIAITLVRVIALNVIARSGYGLTFNYQGAAPLFSFAMNMQLGGLVWFIYNKADAILIGRLLGLDKAGIYNVASEVASIPMSKVNAIMNEVAFSAFAKTKDKMEQAQIYLQKALRLMGCVVFPMFFGLSIISDELVLLLLGDKWAEAGPVIMILCLILPLRMMVSVMINFSAGMGEAKFNLHNAIITAFVLITAIYIGAQQGLNETAWAWVIGFSLVYLILLVRYLVKFRMPVAILLPYWPALLVSMGMWFLVQFVAGQGIYTSIAPDGKVYSLFIIFTLKILTGAFTAGPVLLMLYGKEIKGLLGR
jgi:O-antigen/teichoic acid export membrane protein